MFPPAFPSDLGALMRDRAQARARGQLSSVVPAADRALAARRSAPPRGRERLDETARLIRPLFARAVAEHEALMAEAGAAHYLRKTGWLKLYRSEARFAALQPEFDLAAQFGLPLQALDTAGAQALEPSLNPVFAHAVFWPQAASVSNPLGVTRAYAARFAALGGVTLDRRRALAASRRAIAGGWRPTRAASTRPRWWSRSGPGRRDLLEPLGLKLPLAVKRGYHRHFRAQGQCRADAAGARCRRRLR